MTPHYLPLDIARCNGVGYPSEDRPGETDWRDGCERCLRRLAPAPNGRDVPMMQPPPIVVFECEALIEP